MSRGAALAAGALLAVALGAGAALLDLGLPPALGGPVAAGEAVTTPRGEAPRQVATATVEARMSPDPGRPPSLADVVAFYGLEQDTLPCTVALNEPLAVTTEQVGQLAARPRRLGETVQLCLN